MLRLLFTTQDKSKQLTVITDGIDSQLNVFVTENTVGDIDYFKSLGIMIMPGHIYNVGTFKEWAINNTLILISYPEGLNNESQILVDVVEEMRYFLTTQMSELTFDNTGGDEEVVVTSYKQKYVNGKPSGSPIKVGYDIEIVGVGFDYEVISGGVNVSATENPGTSKRTGTLNISSQESENTATINLSQDASVITYDYTITTNPTSLSFVNTGETKAFTVNSKKQKKLNGNNNGDPTDVGFSFVVNGTGFTKGSGNNVVAAENDTESQRTGNIVVTQNESDKTATINLTQAAGTVTYEYTLSVDPDALNFVAAGETKTFGVSSKKQKKINGKDSGAASVVDYTTVVSGTGFSKGSSEYSVIAEANTGDQRSGQAVVTASEGGKTVTVTLIQDAGASA